MSLEDMNTVCGSFFTIWGTARFTEIYQLGTKWALQVQFGITKVNGDEKQADKYRMRTIIDGPLLLDEINSILIYKQIKK